MNQFRALQILRSPKWRGILARILGMNLLHRRLVLRAIRKWWMRPMLIQRNQAGIRLLNTLMQEQFNGATLRFLRMTKTDFDHLFNLIQSAVTMRDSNMREAITAQERLLITLRYLATGESYSSLEFLFKVSVRSISRIILQVCEAIVAALKEYVRLPSSPEQWLEISEEFENRWDFPHAIGAIDGKHIRIQAPKNSGCQYYNYKGFYSIVLLAVVDAKYNFLYADVGSQGRISDGGVFKNCQLYTRLENKQLNLPAPRIISTPYAKELPYVLLGDKAFALSEYCLRPFTGNPPTCPIQRTFNKRLSRARVSVEDAFGILRSRFRVLDGPILVGPTIASKIVLTTVYLHNFLRNGDSRTVYLPDDAVQRTINGNSVAGSWRTEVETPVSLNPIRTRSPSSVLEMRMDFANYVMNF